MGNTQLKGKPWRVGRRGRRWGWQRQQELNEPYVIGLRVCVCVCFCVSVDNAVIIMKMFINAWHATPTRTPNHTRTHEMGIIIDMQVVCICVCVCLCVCASSDTDEQWWTMGAWLLSNTSTKTFSTLLISLTCIIDLCHRLTVRGGRGIQCQFVKSSFH